jgi:HTH-type transcriptional regulator/antitoxin HigA
MSTAVIKGKGKKKDSYFELVLEFPLRPLHNEKELRAASAMQDRLLDKRKLLPEEQDYFDILVRIVSDYEEKHYPFGPLTDAGILQHFLDARGLSQVDLSREVKISPTIINEILKGKRKLNRTHIGKIIKHFKVSPAMFFDRY